MIAEREREPLPTSEPFSEPLPDIQPESGTPELPAIVSPPATYTCDPTTLDRNMEASELAAIIAMVIGGWSLQLGAEEWAALRPDVRRHFKRSV